MCGCSTQRSDEAGKGTLSNTDGLTLRVDDMTCGHCAGTIKTAIELALPGTQADADPGTRLVSVRGTDDLSAIKAIIESAGYAPSEAA